MTGLPGKSWRLASAPRMMTRSPLASSCSDMRRPCSTVEGAEPLVLGPDAADGTACGVPLADLGDGAANSGLTVLTSEACCWMAMASSTVRRMSRPAAYPPACEPVFPPKKMAMSVPMLRRCSFWSTLKPMPRPTRRITEVMPHTMPNIVRKLRSFVSQSAERVCLRISWNGMVELTPEQESDL